MKKLIILFLLLASVSFGQGIIPAPPKALDPADFTGKYLYSNGTAFVPVSKSEILGYKSYVALLSQAGDSTEPIGIELQNDLGEMTWNYGNVGSYNVSCNALFKANKTFVIARIDSDLIFDSEFFIQVGWRTSSIIDVNILNGSMLNVAGLGSAYIEIRVYN